MVSDDQHLVINPAEAPLVKEIFHRFNNGESMSDIAEDFKRRGIKNRNGRNFYVNTIGNVLRNRRNIGEYRNRDSAGRFRLQWRRNCDIILYTIQVCADFRVFYDLKA